MHFLPSVCEKEAAPILHLSNLCLLHFAAQNATSLVFCQQRFVELGLTQQFLMMQISNREGNWWVVGTLDLNQGPRLQGEDLIGNFPTVSSITTAHNSFSDFYSLFPYLTKLHTVRTDPIGSSRKTLFTSLYTCKCPSFGRRLGLDNLRLCSLLQGPSIPLSSLF
jgi:hypothetical protein